MVKGQNSKILVTAGTIKRPLPCPVEGIEKQGIFHEVKKKKQSKERRKKIRTKTERKKERKLRKKGES